MTSKYNIYCDESGVENKNLKYMVIGAVIIPRDKKDKIVNGINKIYKKYELKTELKWNKANNNKIDLYQEVIDFFSDNKDLSFRCVVVDKTKIEYEKFHNCDHELAFFKFYYFLLRAKLDFDGKFYIFLDRKPTRDKNRARSLKAHLDSFSLYHYPNSQIKHLQAYDSKENCLIQLADFLTGMISFSYNFYHNIGIKKDLTEKVIKKFNLNLIYGTRLHENKFNIFKWIPGEICR